MENKIIINKGSSAKGGQRGNQMWRAHRLEAWQKNAGIKPKKKRRRSESKS